MSKGCLPDQVNIARIPVNISSNLLMFYKYWLELMRPFHKLTSKEVGILAYILMKRYEFAESIADERLINKLLFSSEFKAEMRKDLSLTSTHLHVVLNSFRRKQVITAEGINRRFIPRLDGTKSEYALVFLFDLTK